MSAGHIFPSVLRKSLALVAALLLVPMAAAATLVVIAPHPDDAEASCGGLIANSVAAGEEVVIVTMTGGELGIGGKTPGEARAIRAGEAERAAAALGAKVEFFGAVDGSLAVDAQAIARLEAMLTRLHPSVVVAPWPLDVHADHQAAGLLAWRAFQNPRLPFALYFYETTNAPHTRSFQFVPTDYVDVTEVIKRKQEATYQHVSQNPPAWFEMYATLARAHGYAADVPLAEAYIRARNSSGMGGRSGSVGKTLAAGR